ncbi:MAG TPA: NosD domain-containing protein, partial [Candidatus Polarisedimenticolia bacterium]|nr:NosD domain-containing protein [Candidatus Polarisedimenticolia bacterium]
MSGAGAILIGTLGAGAAVAQEGPPAPMLLVGYSGLEWTVSEGATGYDVIRGDVRLLRDAADGFTSAVRVCLADDQVASQLSYQGIPKPGEAFFFLVRANAGDTVGTFDSGGTGQSAPRDAAIDAATKSCFSSVTPHPPIVIGGDNQFTAQRGVVAGRGTLGDPYLLAGWDIECSRPTNTTGIEIRHTTLAYTIRNVRVRSCGTGILLDRTWNGRVERSRLAANREGVRVSESPVALDGNVIDGIDEAAIRLEAGSSALVQRNTVSGSGIGIDLDGALSSTIRGNTLLSNATHALDRNGASNAWNSQYPQDWSNPFFPQGGNYWSGYAGGDSCSGAQQSVCSGGRPDGFGDTPVTFALAGIDAYPLMRPASDEGDTLPPTLQIDAPALSFIPTITITGAVQDAGTGVLGVIVRTNYGPWMSKGGGATLSFTATLVPGENRIEAQAQDRAGNLSPIAGVIVTYQPPTPVVWQAVLETSQASYPPGTAVTFTVR